MAKNDNTTQTAQAAAPGFHLIVIHPFGAYGKGAHITDAAEIDAVLAGENAGACNRIAVA
jgi:hypothetical protein